MSIKEVLKPISKSNSIKEVSISIFLSNKIADPASFESLINNSPFKDFDRFKVIHERRKEVGFNEETKVEELPNMGFQFISDIDGKEENGISSVFQGRNEIGVSFLSYHHFNYPGWTSFQDNFLSILKGLQDHHGEIFSIAYSLHYINAFEWISEDDMDLGQVFRSESKYLPKSFLKSQDHQYLWIKERIVDGFNYFDRLEMQMTYVKPKAIVISHNATRRLEEAMNITELLKSDDLGNLLNKIHEYNKDTLRDLLCTEVQDLINLNH